MVAQPMPNPEPLDPVMVEVLRKKTGAERLAIAFGMFTMAREMLTASLRARHPDWTDDQVRREVAHRLSHGAV
jgi:hypothetical protein